MDKNKLFRKISIDQDGYLLVPYFAYGSNLHMEQMGNRCPKARPLEAVYAPGYSLLFKGNRKGNGVADIEPTEGQMVVGALYRVTPECLEALDRYEGYPRLYDRYLVEVENLYNQKTVAFVYRMGPEYVEAPPWEGYLKTIEEGFRNWGLDNTLLYEALAGLGIAKPEPEEEYDDDRETDWACQRQWMDGEWWCVNGHVCCVYNDGTDGCTHEGNNPAPLED